MQGSLRTSLRTARLATALLCKGHASTGTHQAIASKLTSSTLVRRLASSSAALVRERPPIEDEEAQEEDPDSGADDFAPEKRTPFKTAEHAMHPLTYKAITQNPFKHTDMSPVQAAVLTLLPQLAEPYRQGELDSPANRRQRDLLVRAKTGTGKTLAVLVPAIEARYKTLEAAGELAVSSSGLGGGDRQAESQMREKAKWAHAREHVGTLIISPTRELASQIATAAMKLTKHHGYNVQLFVGGESKGMQMREWNRGRKDIFVATPGRLKDMLQSVGGIKESLTKINTLVLDEADTLLDMGFRDDIESITRYLPPTPIRQTLLFSATVSPAIQQIARTTLDKNFGYINCVGQDDSPVHEHIPQYYTALPSGAEQLAHLTRLVSQDQLLHPSCSKIILFCNTTKHTQLYTEVLRSLRKAMPDQNTNVMEIHSKKTQEQRARVSDSFRQTSSGSSILVTSDVSARGVDYPGVTRVIQLGIPAGSTQYIHRVGRTGRGRNTEGRGDLVLLPFESRFVKECLSEVPIKPVTVEALEEEVVQLAEKYDANPGAFVRVDSATPRDRYNRSPRQYSRPGPVFGHDLRQRMEGMKQACDQAVERTPQEAVEESFGAMLGFYAGRKDDLRCKAGDIIAGVRAWIKETFGGTPPHLSDNFLARMGLKEGVPAQYRSRSGGRQGTNEWTGRDSRRSSGDSYGARPRWSEGGRSSGDRFSGGSSDRRGGYGSSRSYDRQASPYGGDREGGRRSYGGDKPAYGGNRGDRGGALPYEGSRGRSSAPPKKANDDNDDFW